MKKFLALTLIVVLVAALAVSLAFAVDSREKYKQELDNLYRKSYFDAMDSISDMELKLSKLTVAEGSSSQKQLLNEIWKNAEVAESNLAQLSAKNSEMETIIKFFNQLGDYCYYLASKVEGNGLTEEERNTLDKLYTIITTFQDAFKDTSAAIMDGSSLFTRIGDGVNLLGDCYGAFSNNTSVDYPQMIYDGPFSDGLSDREAKFLKDKPDITREQAEAKAKEYFEGVTELNLITETNGSTPSYMFSITWKHGSGALQITKKGGYVLEYSGNRNTGEPKLSEEQLKTAANNILKKMGYNEMSPVWVTESGTTVYINFAYEKNNIIYYPDLIKVKVARDTGYLIGMEAENYIYNHTGDRSDTAGVKSIESARAKVSKKITIESARLTVIPTEWNSEITAYEFSGSYKEGLFFVYIDALTLNEVKVMKVIDKDGGKLIS